MLYGNNVWPVIQTTYGRCVRDGAPHVIPLNPDNHAPRIAGIASRVKAVERLQPIIAVSTGPDAPIVLVEGYGRATAYWLALGDERTVDAIIGHSPSASSWYWW